ncbi:MAG TPA: TIGR01777 family oxidoreductase [Candidatus Acidoferrum sp.]|nr:TIGR01777 family oxidoreductase [Candidatus Acidoferrum sp.]
MIIVVTGASGFIGRHLLKNFIIAGYEIRVLSRHAGTNLPPGIKLFAWDPLQGPPPEESLHDAGVVVHLAGEPVAQRWSDSVKQLIRDSRIVGTRNLVAGLKAMKRPPDALISSSAVGYYGSRGDEVLKESAGPSDTWLSEVCVEWEREAEAASGLGVRVVPVRTGLVLDPRGGALQQMLPPFRMGVAGKLGSGKQWMSWIHLADLASLFQFAVETPVRGPMNGVAPYPVTNADFTQELAKVLHRPALISVPMAALKLLYGEMAEVLLSSQRAIPAAAEAAGFRFRFPQLGPALANLLG